MRPDEKLALVRGVRSLSFRGNERLGIPALSAVRGAMGISADAVPATAFPANIGIAATWNPALAEQIGAVIAQQARSLGRGLVLGPLAEISQSPLSGAVFESYGEDPLLASGIASAYITGVQGEGEIATAIYRGSAAQTRLSREHELYPLEEAVSAAGVWSVMPASSPSGPVPEMLLNGQLGFRGFVVSPSRSEFQAEGEIDITARSILRAMFASGVFDREDKTTRPLETPEHRAVARTAAAQSIVLLKNEGGLLPLDPARFRSIAVVGPNAAVNRMAAGSYTVAARYAEPPLQALRSIFGSRVTMPGDSLPQAGAAARASDLAIVLVGTGVATEAETRDRTSLDLPAGQDELIQAVAKANPRTIVVIIGGYPVAMDKWLHDVPVVVDAWFPGEEGGPAIADMLSGKVNPSGRLPLAFPNFPFGFGLSYTQFEYSDLVILPDQVPPGQLAEASLNVRNSGSRPGRETVQLYLHALRSESSVKRADQELRAFRQVELNPGETQRVRFTLTSKTTAYFDEQRQDWVQDQAVFEVRVGSSSSDIRVTGTLSVIE